MPDDECAVADAPEPFSLLQVRQLGALGAGEAKKRCGLRGLARLLQVDDLRRAVSESPCANARASDPESPTASRSLRRWMIMRLAMPRPRESFHWDCIRPRRAGWRTSRQASS